MAYGNSCMLTLPVFAASHRGLFLIGTVQFAATMLWWSFALLALMGIGPQMPDGALPASLLHAPVMLFLVLPPFFLGFLLTVFPRWMNYPDTAAKIYLPVVMTLAMATVLFWLGLFSGYADVIFASFAFSGAGWLWALGYMLALLVKERQAGKPPTWHGWSCFTALYVGFMCLIASLTGLMKLDGALIHVANLTALGLFILPVFVTVCHRMIPFFAGNVVEGYIRWRPFSVLAAYWIASVLAAAGYLQGNFAIAATGNTALAALTGLMLWKWTPRAAAPGLLWVLVLGFAWAPLGFGLLSWTDLFAPELARAALHLLTVGLAGSLVVAMVTRVTQGHSGRALTMPPIAWIAFVATQAAAVLRLLAGFDGEDLALLTVAAFCLAIGLLPWALRSVRIYTRPRADGKPG